VITTSHKDAYTRIEPAYFSSESFTIMCCGRSSGSFSFYLPSHDIKSQWRW